MNPDHIGQINGLNRIEGQIKGIKRMIEDSRYCVDILTQLKAAKSALHRVEQEILSTHIQYCLSDAASSSNPIVVRDKVDEIMLLFHKRL